MSLKYRDKNGALTVISGLTPGGNLEAGAVAERSGSFSITDIAVGGDKAFDVVFSEPMPDTDYTIVFEQLTSTCLCSVTDNTKTVNGFQIKCRNLVDTVKTCVGSYRAFKTYTVQHAEQNASDIADIKGKIPSTASSSNKLATSNELSSLGTTIGGRLNALEDTIPSSASLQNQLITETGLTTALQGKQDTLTFDDTPTADSDNPVTSDGIKDAIDGTAADIYEVMGKNGAKNLLPNITVSKTISGITYTRNSNGSVTINGTSTGWGQNDVGKCLLPKGTYTISVGVTVPSGVFFTLRNDDTDSSILNLGNGGTETKRDFTLASDTNVRLYCGISGNVTVSNITFYPMVYLSSDTDSTYQPYALTNQQITPYIQAISNPNILDNGWFTVNQRQFTSATDATTLKPADRWYGSVNDSNITIVNTANGISISGVPNSAGENLIRHAFEWNRISDKVGKTFTLSIMFADGSIKSNSGKLTLPSTDTWQAHITVNIPEQGITVQFLTYGASPNWGEVYIKPLNATSNLSVTIRAIKLELGAVSTLANDVAPNYQQELAKCQRYFIRFKSNATYSVYSDMGYVVSATEVRTPMNLPVSMRQSPTVTTSGSLRIFNATDYSTMSQSITSVSGMGFLGSKLMLKCVGTGFISGKMAMLAADNDANTYIDFSAEL